MDALRLWRPRWKMLLRVWLLVSAEIWGLASSSGRISFANLRRMSGKITELGTVCIGAHSTSSDYYTEQM